MIKDDSKRPFYCLIANCQDFFEVHFFEQWANSGHSLFIFDFST